jgi:hypothetical protein
MAMYGPAQEDFKTAFLSELVRTCQQNPLPISIGGFQYNETQQRKEQKQL